MENFKPYLLGLIFNAYELSFKNNNTENNLLKVLKESYNNDLLTCSILKDIFLQVGILHKLFIPIYNAASQNNYNNFLEQIKTIENTDEISSNKISSEKTISNETKTLPETSKKQTPDTQTPDTQTPDNVSETTKIQTPKIETPVKTAQVTNTPVISNISTNDLKIIANNYTSNIDYSNNNIDNHQLLIDCLNNISNSNYSTEQKNELYEIILDTFLFESIINEKISVLNATSKTKLIDQNILKIYNKIYNKYKKRVNRSKKN